MITLEKIMKQSKENLKKEKAQLQKPSKQVAVIIHKATPVELANTDWYKSMIEEISAIATETVFEAQSTLLKGKFEIGKAMNDQASKKYPITELVKFASQDLHISERELWYCVKFNAEYKKIEKLPDFDSKAISWNKVKKMLADPEKAKKPCKHEHTVTITICEDCGKRIEKKITEQKIDN